jgi:uncharacterized protein with PIN domain
MEKCYLCGWVGEKKQCKKIKTKGPMFGTDTTGYKCPKCKKIFMYDGEQMPGVIGVMCDRSTSN